MIGSRLLVEYPSGTILESDEVFHSWAGEEPKIDDNLSDYFSSTEGNR